MPMPGGAEIEFISGASRVSAGVLMLVLVPGFPWTYALLGRTRLSAIERIGVSVVLSIAAVPVALFLVNILLGVPIDATTTLALAAVVALTGAAVALRRGSFRVRPLRPAAPDVSAVPARLASAATLRLAARLLVLGLIMGLAFYIGMIPRLDYSYPLHTDEWTHLAEASAIASEGDIPFHDPITGEARSDSVVEGTTSSPHFEVGYQLFLAEVRLVTGLPWLTIFRFLPSSVFALTVLGAYIFGARRGFGLEAAVFATLVPTTVRFLGPAFAVPVALGLLFVLLILFLVSNLWSSRGLPLLLLPLLAFLFIAHPPTALMASLVIVVYGLFQTVRRATTRRRAGRRAVAHLAAILVVIALSALPPVFYHHWLLGAAASAAPLPREALVAPGGIIPRLGYLPYPLFVAGLVALARSGLRADRALLVITVLVGLYTFLHYEYGVGNAAIYSRFVLYLSMLVLLIAALATSRMRSWLATTFDRAGVRWAPLAAAVLVLPAFVVPSLALGLQSRYEERYYRRIHETEYEDFVWIRDNLCPGYQRALTLPRFGRAFAAITGRYAYAVVPSTAAPVTEPRVQEATRALQDDLADTAWLDERDVSIVYSQRPLQDPDLIAVRERVYVLPPDEVCAGDGRGEPVEAVRR